MRCGPVAKIEQDNEDANNWLSFARNSKILLKTVRLYFCSVCLKHSRDFCVHLFYLVR